MTEPKFNLPQFNLSYPATFSPNKCSWTKEAVSFLKHNDNTEKLIQLFEIF
jgi:hypothetical protein